MPTSHAPTPFGLIFVLCALALSGCSHQSSQNRVAVPTKDFPFSFSQSPFINPRIIQDLSSWISDHGDQIVAINVLESQDSNRYFGDTLVRNIEGKNPYIYAKTATVKDGETNHTGFGYNFVGVTSSGIYVVETSCWSGGSGCFRTLMLLSFEHGEEFECDFGKNEIRSRKKRLLIKKLGEITLGDRWAGDLKVMGDSIFVGKDRGWFTVSGGTGGSGLTYEQKEHLLKICH